MEFFFENPLLIFIILGILSSLFGKGKEEKSQKRRATPQPKPFVESKPLPKIEPKLEPAKTSTKPEKKEPEIIWEQSKIQEQYLQKLEEETEEIPSLVKEVVGEEENPKRKIERDELAKDKIVDAIIWAEILGPPRSKKPHRFMNYR